MMLSIPSCSCSGASGASFDVRHNPLLWSHLTHVRVCSCPGACPVSVRRASASSSSASFLLFIPVSANGSAGQRGGFVAWVPAGSGAGWMAAVVRWVRRRISNPVRSVVSCCSATMAVLVVCVVVCLVAVLGGCGGCSGGGAVRVDEVCARVQAGGEGVHFGFAGPDTYMGFGMRRNRTNGSDGVFGLSAWFGPVCSFLDFPRKKGGLNFVSKKGRVAKWGAA